MIQTAKIFFHLLATLVFTFLFLAGCSLKPKIGEDIRLHLQEVSVKSDIISTAVGIATKYIGINLGKTPPIEISCIVEIENRWIADFSVESISYKAYVLGDVIGNGSVALSEPVIIKKNEKTYLNFTMNIDGNKINPTTIRSVLKDKETLVIKGDIAVNLNGIKFKDSFETKPLPKIKLSQY